MCGAGGARVHLYAHLHKGTCGICTKTPQPCTHEYTHKKTQPPIPHCRQYLAFPPTLVNIAGSVIEHSQHGDDAVGGTIGAPDVAAHGTNVVNGKTNTVGDGDQVVCVCVLLCV